MREAKLTLRGREVDDLKSDTWSSTIVVVYSDGGTETLSGWDELRKLARDDGFEFDGIIADGATTGSA